MRICLTITNDMSKAEELLILQKLREAFKANSDNYLTNFFSVPLLTWAETQMKNDFPCDVMEGWDAVEARLRSAEDAVNKAASEAKSNREIAEKVAEKTVVDLQNKDEQLASLDWLKNNLDRLLQESVAENGEVSEMMDAAVVRSEGLEREIIALKARLYDAGVAREKGGR